MVNVDNTINDIVKENKNKNKGFDWNPIGEGNFSDFGDSSMYFKYRRLAFIPTAELNSMLGRGSKQLVNQNSITLGEFINDLEDTVEKLIGLCIEWNLEFNGEKFPLPSEDKRVWQRIPSFVNNYIVWVIKNDPTNIDLLTYNSSQDSFLERNSTNTET